MVREYLSFPTQDPRSQGQSLVEDEPYGIIGIPPIRVGSPTRQPYTLFSTTSGTIYQQETWQTRGQ